MTAKSILMSLYIINKNRQAIGVVLQVLTTSQSFTLVSSERKVRPDLKDTLMLTITAYSLTDTSDIWYGGFCDYFASNL